MRKGTVQRKENTRKIDSDVSPYGPSLSESSYLICLPERSVPDVPDQGGNDTGTIVSSVSKIRSHHNNPDSYGKTAQRP